MGAALDMVGLGGDEGAAAGMNFNARGTNLLNTTDQSQLDTAYGQTQQGIQQQQDFLNALAAQNGVGNQSNVFSQQAALAGQLQGMANGQGPNVAQNMLNQATATNVANQAALAAGQRGAGANAGLIARQAAMAGGNAEQQAAGQGATMRSQQQLAALSALGQQQANMANLATTQVGQQSGAVSNYNSAVQGQQANLLGGAGNLNKSKVDLQNGMNSANSNVANTVAGTQGKTIGGILNGAAGAFAHGGEVKKYANGGVATPSLGVDLQMPQAQVAVPQYIQQNNDAGPKSNVAKALLGGVGQSMAPSNPMGFDQKDSVEQGGEAVGGALMNGAKSIFGGSSSPQADALQAPEMGSQFAGEAPSLGAFAFSKGGKVPAKVSPGEVYLSPKDVKEVKEGKKSPMAGEKIGGKAKVKGDSLKNDVVSKTLESGGIVLPRSVTQSEDPAHEAYKFVQAILARKKLK